MTYSLHNLNNDPNSTSFRGHPEGGTRKPIRAGDRILVQKYLYEIFEPKPFDVIVFKNPQLSTQNYNKRLVGLYHGMYALVGNAAEWIHLFTGCAAAGWSCLLPALSLPLVL